MKRAATNSIPVMTRVTPKLKRRLQALARSTKRSESYLAAEAIEQYISVNEWQIAHIKSSFDEWKEGKAANIPHEDVARWLASWGSDDERPPPKA